MHDLSSHSENDISHLFLSPVVNSGLTGEFSMAHISISGKFTGKISPRPATRTTKKKPTGRRQKKTAPTTKRVVLSAFFS